jgi:short-chain fatty acids transporter
VKESCRCPRPTLSVKLFMTHYTSARAMHKDQPASPQQKEGRLERVALSFTELSERRIPGAFIFALLATGLIFVLGLSVAHAGPTVMVAGWGKGFWELIPFSMQMSLIIISGYVVATSSPVFRLIRHIATLPRTDRGATLLVACLR